MSYEKAKALIRNSISRPTLYRVQMPQRFIGRGTNDYLEYYCNATAIPERRVEAVVARGHENMGVSRYQPALILWGQPMQISVIENRDFTVHRDFSRWFEQLGTAVDQQGQRNIRMSYYDQIKGDIILEKLEQPDVSGGVGGSLKTVMTTTFLNAYPKAIGNVSLASDNRDSYTTFNVEFTYESYTVEYS
jgi:hypothetical protein